MQRNESTAVVESCFHGCPFFSTEGMEHLMLCEHPYWHDKGSYAGAIITHDNSHGRVPDKCPLKREPIAVVRTVGLRKDKR